MRAIGIQTYCELLAGEGRLHESPEAHAFPFVYCDSALFRIGNRNTPSKPFEAEQLGRSHLEL